jgi:microcystin-dependent protein
MFEPFLGQINITAFAFAPKGWALCNGQLLPISQFQALFSLLGTLYGGNGTTTFALPDLRGRTPMHRGNSLPLGAATGAEAVALNAGQLPPHSHALAATTDLANASVPDGALTAARARGGPLLYASGGPPVAMKPASVAMAGGNLPHPNMQPYTVLNFVIALTGIYPSRD